LTEELCERPFSMPKDDPVFVDYDIFESSAYFLGVFFFISELLTPFSSVK
jgi:hypothetical protein